MVLASFYPCFLRSYVLAEVLVVETCSKQIKVMHKPKPQVCKLQSTSKTAVIPSLTLSFVDSDLGAFGFGVFLAILIAVIIIGGVHRIANATSKIVPAMVGIYLLSAAVVVVTHLPMVPFAIYQVFAQAFSPDAIYGGICWRDYARIQASCFF